MNKSLLSVLLLAAAASAAGATRTVTLSVPGMTCPACPLTVERALSRVDGVADTHVNFGRREVTVRFDDARTNPKALAEASANAGYPSRVEK